MMTTNKLEERARARREALRVLLGVRRHLEGCPEELEDTGKVEVFEVESQGHHRGGDLRGVEPGTICTTVRCTACGGQRTLTGRPEDHLDRQLGES